MIEELVCAYVLDRLDDLAAYYATLYKTLGDPWAQYRSQAVATLSKQYQRTGIKALVDFQTQRQKDLRAALRGTIGLYASPHFAEDSATHARYLQTLFYEGRLIAGLIGLA